MALTVKQLTLICMDLIAAGHADRFVFDSENPTFAIAEINVKDTGDVNGDPDAFISIEWEEVK